MYRCHFCHESSKPYDKLNLVVTQTRIVMTPEGRQMPQIVEERPRCKACSEFAEQKDLHEAIRAIA